MPTRGELNFSTGDRVVETGVYECEAGEKRSLRSGDDFPACPINGNDTSWRRKKD